MDERLKQLLKLVVEDAAETGEPVGSQHLVEAYALDVSPATVRNGLAELEELGYLTHPHTSSGRLPTEKGYRFYVDQVMEKKPLGRRDRAALEKALQAAPAERRSRETAKAVAEILGSAFILGLPPSDSFYTGLGQLFAQPEFRDWSHVASLSEVLDRLDDVLDQVRNRTYLEPSVFIGRECPFGPLCSVVFLTLADGTLMGALGPMRMDYAKTHAALIACYGLLS